MYAQSAMPGPYNVLSSSPNVFILAIASSFIFVLACFGYGDFVYLFCVCHTCQ